ncbi:aspartate aminotransferase family protein [Streptomyces afghaniensis]|uniref:aspartate aminotransferase family protein n=1 Tax=Streptomyces TaxID=1883 RepID=UPI0003FB20DA|nr:aminotransferase class III-fold pyridoxal phosphate-dependent enzyme [Streptomyces sp. HP-A2021]UOB12712.1 aminotransferase class III-fold pyridoxal phosphate-dependent enzyme [Streptomyces sp. HP-A2021]
MKSATGATTAPFESVIGRGAHLYIQGKKHIDCASGTFNVSLGYTLPEVTDAVHAQLDRCAHLSSDLTKAKSREIFELLRAFLPDHIDSYWFRDIIGSTANECAVRMAQKATGRTDVVSLFLSHHGQSIAATGMSGNAFRQRSFHLPIAGSLKIPAPDCARCFYRQVPESCGMLCAQRLEDFVEFASSGQVAALIIEPVLGNGGNITPPVEYYSVLRDICDRHGILIIADEVQTGFGRTGTFFASNGYAKELKPDIITFAKGAGGIGIPVAGVLMRKELDVLESWEHSTTSGANPLALVALEATVKYIRDHEILENVAIVSKILRDGLTELSAFFPRVSNVKGIGLMLAFDLPSAADVARFIAISRENGVIVRGSRYGFGNTVKVRPPLTTTESDVHDILTSLRTSLQQLESE